MLSGNERFDDLLPFATHSRSRLRFTCRPPVSIQSMMKEVISFPTPGISRKRDRPGCTLSLSLSTRRLSREIDARALFSKAMDTGALGNRLAWTTTEILPPRVPVARVFFLVLVSNSAALVRRCRVFEIGAV